MQSELGKLGQHHHFATVAQHIFDVELHGLGLEFY